ncbi:hypothetical protein L218DRAFT_587460 [Marasmius fiardii PR-910]|nr:hypothetical protein L218DRAFT_587460 [Marasmius fiardii PR-910]
MFGEISPPLTERNGAHFRDRVLAPPIEERMVYDETEEENGGRSGNAPSKSSKISSKFAAKLRSRSKSRTRKDGEGSQEPGDGLTSPTSSHTKSPRGKRLFSRKPTSLPSPDNSAMPDYPSKGIHPMTSIEHRAVPGSLGAPPRLSPSKSLKSLFRKDVHQGNVVSRPHDDLTFPTAAEVEGMTSDRKEEGPRPKDLKAAKRLSYAVPQSAFQSLQRVRQKPKPPDLTVTINSRKTISASQSLPPSPFLLVTPDAWNDQKEDGLQPPPTPYVLCSPVDESELRKRLSSPIQSKLPPTIPVSVSKSVRDSSNDGELIIFQSTTQVENDMARKTASIQVLSQNAPSSFTSRPATRRTSLRARESPFPIRPIRAVPVSLI